MNSFIHADIFFVVSSVSLVVLTSLFVVILVYVIKIVANLHALSHRARIEATYFLGSIQGLRESLEVRHSRMHSLFRFIGYFFGRSRSHSASSSRL